MLCERAYLGVLTKCDNLSFTDVKNHGHKVPALKIILDKPDMARWKVKYGWWPFRGKDLDDVTKKISQAEYHDTQRTFFEKPKWAGVQEAAGRRFGVGPMREMMGKIFLSMVADS